MEAKVSKLPEGVPRTAEDYELEIEYWKSRLSDLCNQAWGKVYPDKTDWEYAAQAVRHLMMYNDELKVELESLKTDRLERDKAIARAAFEVGRQWDSHKFNLYDLQTHQGYSYDTPDDYLNSPEFLELVK